MHVSRVGDTCTHTHMHVSRVEVSADTHMYISRVGGYLQTRMPVHFISMPYSVQSKHSSIHTSVCLGLHLMVMCRWIST